MKQEEISRLSEMWSIENSIKEKGIKYIAGVDEAGRGPLAGDVYAAAVILPDGILIEGLNDSKKISEKKRDLLYDEIIKNALCYAVAVATVKEIDEFNIRNATYIAMNRAISALNIKPGYVLVDGDCIKDCPLPHECVIKGDAYLLPPRQFLQRYRVIAICLKWQKNIPATGLKSIKATEQRCTLPHLRSLVQVKFTEKLLSKNSSEKPKAVDIGTLGENEAVRILKKHGYKIIERNFRTRFGEIDIIAKDKEYTCFVEVKLRKSSYHGTASEMVDAAKQKKIIRAAKIYAYRNRLFESSLRFDVVAIEAFAKDNKLYDIKSEVIKNAFEVQYT